MIQRFYFILFSLLFLSACSATIDTIKNTFSKKHAEKSNELESIMHKFDNLVFQHFQSELERDEKRIVYTNKMVTLVDELVENSKELQKHTNDKSTEFMTYANALEHHAQKLKQSVSNYKTEEIPPTLANIQNLCKQCHATFK